jgi:hypothetical protein
MSKLLNKQNNFFMFVNMIRLYIPKKFDEKMLARVDKFTPRSRRSSKKLFCLLLMGKPTKHVAENVRLADVLRQKSCKTSYAAKIFANMLKFKLEFVGRLR